MTIFLRASFSVLALMFFAGSLFGQEMTPQQKQIVEKLERQNKIEKTKRDELKKQFGIGESKKTKGAFYREEGVGLTTKNISQGRDLSQYEKGGHIDCRDWAAKDKLSLECNERILRDFVWSHWNGRKRGYITMSGDSVDASATLHIFIEPNKKGEWIIIWRIARFQALFGGRFSIDDFPIVTFVERFENNINKDEWKLILKDKLGKTRRELPNFW